jgi:hypothetical protein
VKKILPYLIVLPLACGGENPTNFMKDVAAQVKTHPRVQMSIRLRGEEPTSEELELRRQVEQRIEQDNVGRLISTGAGGGYMDLTVEVDNTADAIEKMRKIALDLEVLRGTSFKVLDVSR